MKKFKDRSYGIVREYDEVTLWLSRLMMIWMRWFCGIAVGRFFRYSQSRGKKEEKEATRRADAIGLLETARSGRGGNAELPWRAGWPPRKGRAVWHHLPHGSGRQPPGRPGAARGIWSCPCGSWWPLGKGRAAYASSFPHGGGS